MCGPSVGSRARQCSKPTASAHRTDRQGGKAGVSVYTQCCLSNQRAWSAPVVCWLAAALGACSQPPLCGVVDRVQAQGCTTALSDAVGIQPARHLWEGGRSAGRCPPRLQLVLLLVRRATAADATRSHSPVGFSQASRCRRQQPHACRVGGVGG